MKAFNYFIHFCLFFILTNNVFTQNFIPLSDASGYDLTSFEMGFQEATNEVLDLFIEDSYQDSFHVFDFGTYLHHEDYKEGIESILEEIKIKVTSQSKYYLLIGRIINDLGMTRFVVDSELPDYDSFNCIASVDRISINSMAAAAMKEHLGGNKFAYKIAEAEKVGIDFFKEQLNHIVYCTCKNNLRQTSRKRSTNCEEKCDYQTINIRLLGSKFRKREVEVGSGSVPWDNSRDIYDFANKTIRVGGELVSIPEQVLESKITFDNLLTGKVFILDNESFCNGEWEQYESAVSNPINDYVECWVILNEGDKNYLYSLYTLSAFPISGLKDSQAHSRSNNSFLPMKYVIQVLGNAALDACLQAVIYRIIDEDVENWEQAFGKVSGLGALWEGMSSLLPWKKAKQAEIYLSAATSAFVVVIDNALRDENYTIEQGLIDFTVGFGASVLTQLVTHPKVTNRLGNNKKYVVKVFSEGLDRFYGHLPRNSILETLVGNAWRFLKNAGDFSTLASGKVKKAGGQSGDVFIKIGMNNEDLIPNFYKKDNRWNALSFDPDQRKITQGARREAIAGLEAEKQGILKSLIKRGPKKTDFLDGNNIKWDVKTPPSNEFFELNLENLVNGTKPGSIINKIKNGTHILIDCTYLNSKDLNLLRQKLQEKLTNEELAFIKEVNVLL